ncbi:MAG: peptidylprolyl isomerase [Clostridia bacterium]|nr:peptidylprolyl isomerase [Clostridia bacterium]
MSTQKTANDYREERKARLAKAAKQNSKKSHKLNGPKMSKKAKTIISIVLVVVIALAAGILACNGLGVFERMKTISTVGGDSYSAVEYEYYYKSVHNYFYQMSAQYDSYYGQGYGAVYTGYDTTKAPADQEYPYSDYTLEDGKKATWQQFFEHIALQNMQRNIILSDMAKEAGFEIDAAAQAEVDDQLQQLRDGIKEQAGTTGQVVSLGTYLRSAYGKGMSESKFLKIVERETLATEYNKHLLATNSDNYSVEELEKVYKEDPSAYNCVDFRLFNIAPDTSDLAEDATEDEKKAATEKAEKAAKEKADKMFAELTDEASFIELAKKYATDAQKESYDYDDPDVTLSKYVQKATLEGSFGEETIKWLYSDKAKAGEKKLFEENGNYYIFLMLKPSYRDNETIPVDVRHILYQIDETATDKDAEDKAQKAKAEAALSAINKAPDKLAKFLELVETESADTGSSSNGGLYEKVGRGQYVPEFEAWALDPARQEGDIEVVKTDYGYHVMYFVKAYTKPAWQLTISETLASEALEEDLTAAYETDKYAVAKDNKTIAELNTKIYDELKANYYAA